MANSIALFTSYVPILDEVYKNASKTAVLDSNENLVSLVGKEFKIPKMTLQGLANHGRTNGGKYIDGDVTLTFQTKAPDWDRNRKFNVDSMDNLETAGVAFGTLAGEFIRTKVVPEADAVRFGKYHAAAGNKPTGTLANGTEFLAAVEVGINVMDEAEVPEEGRWLFGTPSQINSVMSLDTTKSREVLSRFEGRIVKVPQSRFYTEVTLLDGTTSGQEAGGYAKTTSTGKDINFMIIHPSAIIQALKHVAPKYIPASENQTADGDSFAYRAYGIATFLDNKVAAIYSHSKA